MSPRTAAKVANKAASKVIPVVNLQESLDILGEPGGDTGSQRETEPRPVMIYKKPAKKLLNQAPVNLIHSFHKQMPTRATTGMFSPTVPVRVIKNPTPVRIPAVAPAQTPRQVRLGATGSETELAESGGSADGSELPTGVLEDIMAAQQALGDAGIALQEAGAAVANAETDAELQAARIYSVTHGLLSSLQRRALKLSRMILPKCPTLARSTAAYLRTPAMRCRRQTSPWSSQLAKY